MVITPKVFANSSPGLEQSDNPGIDSSNIFLTLKGLLSRQTLSGLNQLVARGFPELSLRSNSGLELSNAFGVYLETHFFKNQTSLLDTVSTGSGSDLVRDQHAISIVDQIATAPCTDCIQA
jgi:hypothetical protein